ncbi:MAG: Uma2 family endonuclease [Methylococcaceae bacterium]|nr:Uma2 family endonuclease [Methylococcaceae bacterium]
MGLALKDSQTYTYADYLTWSDDARYELIDGHAYYMAPAPDLTHQDIAGEIFRQVANSLKGKKCRAFIAPVDVRLSDSNQDNANIINVVQPDVFVVCDPNKFTRRGILGAPDWIVEVLSPSTAGHDQIIKRQLYEHHGVREYWLVHPTDRVLTVYRLENGEYGKPELYELIGATPIGALPGCVIQWDELVASLPNDYE